MTQQEEVELINIYERKEYNPKLESLKPNCEYSELIQYKCTLLYDQAICQPYSRYFESCPNRPRKEITPAKMKQIHNLMKQNN
ncbi:hypothetical protein CONCODRAFT_78293 [Conidiobolus coronatus NRRL 28638]|uniref:Uncharacterized protein n=1 Tax=Conidiobolus coronatus (strain ATCC 28846 / CBS 209.66 / NRRL 28638) TaxID=796925 RepID=A0A137P947_CONC2|nr:hypothetical protein CONCODRAFT_78293 [Conidiobolus coronatus NRRL 28638]|eukprot:KXN71537.1 hypothetical protein CONCODRAFT_78293 [Conidiobolus coronatus NRRL 28638]